jgi:hypothetical protein
MGNSIAYCCIDPPRNTTAELPPSKLISKSKSAPSEQSLAKQEDSRFSSLVDPGRNTQRTTDLYRTLQEQSCSEDVDRLAISSQTIVNL